MGKKKPEKKVAKTPRGKRSYPPPDGLIDSMPPRPVLPKDWDKPAPRPKIK